MKWVKMGTLTDEQIKEELKWVKKARFYETHKVSGMITDTTIKNFRILSVRKVSKPNGRRPDCFNNRIKIGLQAN